MRRLAILLATLAVLGRAAPACAESLTLPLREDSVRFAVIGDSGTGGDPQYRVAERMVEYHARFPFEFVLMLGDNIYGSADPDDVDRKFERPYKPLLDAGVKFFAALGNHDNVNERFYKLFNMNGERFYSFKSSRQSARFFVLDSNYVVADQLRWLEDELEKSDEAWKICYFHHPLYTSGVTHGPSVAIRDELEPLFVRHGVSVVLTGHEHVYERLKPQKGIYYFVSGSAAKLRENDLRPERGLTASGFDRGYHFMMMEIAGDDLYFQAVSDRGETIDSGVLHRPGAAPANAADSARTSEGGVAGNRPEHGVPLLSKGRHPRVDSPAAPVRACRGEQCP